MPGRANTNLRTKLQVANGDVIEARYFDASANLTRVATARADFLAPVLTGVSSSNSFGQVIISWSSDEPATSIVRYGTNATLAGMNQAVTNSVLTTAHSISLTRLVPGTTYYFYVVSSDEAGNRATNNNNGALFSIVPASTPPLLFIDEYASDPISGGSPPLKTLIRPRWRNPSITDSVFTDPLIDCRFRSLP